MKPHNIVFSSGSMGGLAFIGAWKALQEQGLTKDITRFSGCSIGSVMALLCNIGYSSEELETIAINFRFKDVSDCQMLNVFQNLGIDSGNDIERLLRELLYFKTGHYDLTFAMLYGITGRQLWINASCVEQDRPYYFSYIMSPHMSVIKAVRMSISIPIVIAPVRYNGLTFVDGGLHDPCPVGMFPIPNTLVLRIKNTDHETHEEYDFVKYVTQMLGSVYRRIHTIINQQIAQYHVILLDTGVGLLSLNIKRSVRRKLINSGYDKLKAIFNQNVCDP